MKKIFLMLTMFVMSTMVFGQVTFEPVGPLSGIVTKAAKEKKMVFIDAYATWCAPCKLMDKNIFPLESVGNFINKNFVAVKYDMEAGEGLNVAKKYKVTSYPTFIILNSKGEEIARIIGASSSGSEFIKKIEDAIKK